MGHSSQRRLRVLLRLRAKRTPDPVRLASGIARLEGLDPADRARLLADIRGLMRDSSVVDDLVRERRAAANDEDEELMAPGQGRL